MFNRIHFDADVVSDSNTGVIAHPERKALVIHLLRATVPMTSDLRKDSIEKDGGLGIPVGFPAQGR